MTASDIVGIIILSSPITIAALFIAFLGLRKLKIQDIELNVHKRQRFERIRWIFNEQLPVGDCPVMFLRGAVLKDKPTGKNLLQLKFINTGTQTIKSAYASIDFIDDAGDIIANGSTIQAEYLDINCESNGTFGQKKLLELGNVDATHIRIEFSKIVFTDGTVWRAEKSIEPPKPAKVTLLKNSLLPELQSEISEEAICKPEILSNGLWRCTCGCLADNGIPCANCQRTFAQAQEDTDISVLEQQLRNRIAEREQQELEEKIKHRESKNCIIQFVWAVLAYHLGIIFFFVCICGFLNGGTISIYVSFLYAGISGISTIATSILVRKTRKGDSTSNNSIRSEVKIQGTTALVLCATSCVMFALSLLKLLLIENGWKNFPDFTEFIVMLIIVLFCILPQFAYCAQSPFARNWLKKHYTKRYEKIACAVCLISVIVAVSFIIKIPSCMHFYWGGGFSFDSEIVLPSTISIVWAAGSILYCRRLPIVKDWLTKQKSKKQKK